MPRRSYKILNNLLQPQRRSLIATPCRRGGASGLRISRYAAWLLALVGLTAIIPGCAAVRSLIARASAAPLAGLHIVSPRDHSVLLDGNLFQIQGLALDPVDGIVDRVEVAFDLEDTWHPVQRGDLIEPAKWAYLWKDPAPGLHRIRARAFGLGDREATEESVAVEVRDTYSTAFAIDNPYATPGQFRKGQLHVHSTNSFDGWTSLPPSELAAEYRRRGYSFMAITDHDVVSRINRIAGGDFLSIPAYESTSESGHITGLWTSNVALPSLAPQVRLDHMTAQGGMAILNHPGWRVGWSGADFAALKGYFGFEVYNGVTSTDLRAERNLKLWHDLLNAKGWANRVWAIAVDDAHEPRAIDRGWIEVKVPQLTHRALRYAFERGALFASNGPTFEVLGVSNGAIMASSPNAQTIRFIDQDLKILAEGPATGARYRPSGRERWVRVEAVRADGRTAWSQPFWLLANEAAGPS